MDRVYFALVHPKERHTISFIINMNLLLDIVYTFEETFVVYPICVPLSTTTGSSVVHSGN